MPVQRFFGEYEIEPITIYDEKYGLYRVQDEIEVTERLLHLLNQADQLIEYVPYHILWDIQDPLVHAWIERFLKPNDRSGGGKVPSNMLPDRKTAAALLRDTGICFYLMPGYSSSVIGYDLIYLSVLDPGRGTAYPYDQYGVRAATYNDGYDRSVRPEETLTLDLKRGMVPDMIAVLRNASIQFLQVDRVDEAEAILELARSMLPRDRYGMIDLNRLRRPSLESPAELATSVLWELIGIHRLRGSYAKASEYALDLIGMQPAVDRENWRSPASDYWRTSYSEMPAKAIIADTLIKAGQWTAAESLVEESALQHPMAGLMDTYNLWLKLVYIDALLAQGKTDEAELVVRDFEVLIREDGASADDTVSFIASELDKRNLSSTGIIAAAAWASMSSGHRDGALEYLGRIIASDPCDDYAYGQLRRLHLSARNYDKLLDLSGAAFDNSGCAAEKARFSFDMGIALFMLKRYEDAVKKFHTSAGLSKEYYDDSMQLIRVCRFRQAKQAVDTDDELTLKEVQKNPDRYKGKGIDWEGSVLDVWEKGGKTTVQLIADGDVAFVTIDQVLKGIVKGNDIRVAGVVSGSQTYQALSGQIKTVPTIKASCVLLASDFTIVLR